GLNGGGAYNVHWNPAVAISQVFADFTPPDAGTMQSPPKKTLRDRLADQRQSLLDSLVGSIASLRPKLGAADRARLDEHTALVRSLEERLAADGGTSMPAGLACVRPDETMLPTYGLDDASFAAGQHPEYARSAQDPNTAPIQIETMVRALA